MIEKLATAAIGIAATVSLVAANGPAAANPHKWKPSVESRYGGNELRWPWSSDEPETEAAPATLQPTERLLLDSSEDTLQNDIAYPTAGDARVTATILTLEAGQRGKVLQHETPMFAYVLEGEITLNYGRNGWKAFKAGESMLQPMGRPFRTINSGDGTAKVLLVSMGATGAARAQVVAE